MDPYSMQILIMNQISQWSGAFIGQVRAALFALAWFIFGLIASEICKFLVVAIFRGVSWDRWCRRWGWERRLHAWRADVSPTSASAEIVFWIVLVSFTMNAVQRLDINWISWVGRKYFLLLPDAAKATAFLVFSYWLGRLGARIITSLVGPSSVWLVAGLWQALICNLGIYGALVTVGLERGWSQTLVSILLAGSVLGLVLSWVRKAENLRPVVRIEELKEAD